MTEPLAKVDSAVDGVDVKDNKTVKKPRQSTVAAAGVFKLEDLVEEGKTIQIAKQTQKTGWKINTSPNTVEDKDILKLHLTEPPIKKIDLHFPLGLEVTARNLKGVTIKDAMDAIHKPYKKKQDDELPEAYLKGFEYDPEESKTRLVVHLTSTPEVESTGGKKKKKNKGEE
ncbi:hypothetical protein M406DRAFT_358165 [Cryphonectria parasitica EP155]|uniref:DUF6699 domain-containing protein n=1 Tax=Cryphonectria parasitica (strain ATCC 38755 / EP155) TaxID=660469 RepID=A0A9P4XVW0_CRYP1|nr:uncharacterized protein M406DRAFT_358165 [Cryphonectria parasitica EP155]KAF3761968.1 hypothetical protein M406DRAFT_358165 [Cryphonectria parasitica EP155]